MSFNSFVFISLECTKGNQKRNNHFNYDFGKQKVTFQGWFQNLLIGVSNFPKDLICLFYGFFIYFT